MTAEPEAAACTEKELANLGPVSAPPEEKEDDEEQQHHLYEIRKQKNKRSKEQKNKMKSNQELQDEVTVIAQKIFALRQQLHKARR